MIESTVNERAASAGGADWAWVRAQFPITKTHAYLNHCAIGAGSLPVARALAAFEEQRQLYGSLANDEVVRGVARTRAKAADFIGARTEEIAFVKNTPEGLSLVAAGLEWRPGDNVVTAALEFPANVHPWLNLRPRGVEVRIVEADAEGRLPADRILAQVDDRTRVVALSWVEFCNGFRNDLATIGAECRRRNARLVVDAIQGAGALLLDVRALNVDYLAFACHKWMLGPVGIGVLYVRDELLDELSLVEVGQSNYQYGESWLDYERPLKPTAGRFECGMVSTLCVHGLEAAIDLFNAAGRARIEERILSLTDRLLAGVPADRYEHWGSTRPGERSGIVSFRPRHQTAAEVVAALERANVVGSEREGAVRLAAHCYNDETDVDRAIEALRKV
ncbi:MAG: aminotransferase class V-fold PLP-dependent enzyme [Chloroflexi bacterium]|nr:aminotransferase class V-fold PLP-dependent enzyme [Chloroflexota bacterium]